MFAQFAQPFFNLREACVFRVNLLYGQPQQIDEIQADCDECRSIFRATISGIQQIFQLVADGSGDMQAKCAAASLQAMDDAIKLIEYLAISPAFFHFKQQIFETIQFFGHTLKKCITQLQQHLLKCVRIDGTHVGVVCSLG